MVNRTSPNSTDLRMGLSIMITLICKKCMFLKIVARVLKLKTAELGLNPVDFVLEASL